MCAHVDADPEPISGAEFTLGNRSRQQFAHEIAEIARRRRENFRTVSAARQEIEEQLHWFALRLYLVAYSDAVPHDTQNILALPVGQPAEMA